MPKLVLALALALLAAAPATAAAETELTRDEYVAKLEPTCKRNAQANERILKGVKQQVQGGQVVPAGKRFIRASGVLGKSVAQMAKVPRPVADAVKLKKWFGYLKQQKVFLRLIGKSLKSNKKGRAIMLARKLKDSNIAANNTVITYGFKHCRIEQSRFI